MVISRPIGCRTLARSERAWGHMVAGGRYKVYSNYALKIQAVAASVTARGPRMDGEGPDLSDHA